MEPQRGNAATCAQKVKWREITIEIVADQHLPGKMLLAALVQQYGLGAEGLWEAGPRERTGVDCCEDTLKC